jgi:hypothetical protein
MSKLQIGILATAAGSLIGTILRPGVQEIVIVTIAIFVLVTCLRKSPSTKPHLVGG